MRAKAEERRHRCSDPGWIVFRYFVRIKSSVFERLEHQRKICLREMILAPKKRRENNVCKRVQDECGLVILDGEMRGMDLLSSWILPFIYGLLINGNSEVLTGATAGGNAK